MIRALFAGTCIGLLAGAYLTIGITLSVGAARCAALATICATVQP